MSSNERSTVVGVFGDRDRAQSAIGALRDIGFSESQIGFAMREYQGDQPVHDATVIHDDANPGSGAATGLATGAVAGGVIGALAAGLIPGIGPVIAVGLLAGILGGAGIGAAAGGILGALTEAGVPEDEAHYYAGEFNNGRGIVTVRAGDRYDEAERVLRDFGAYDVHHQTSTSSASSADQTRGFAGQAPTRNLNATTASINPTGASVPHVEQQYTPTSESWNAARPTYRASWHQQYGANGGKWEDVEPAYQHGFQFRNNPRFAGQSFSQAEPELRRDWESHGYMTPWTEVRVFVEHVWNDANEKAA